MRFRFRFVMSTPRVFFSDLKSGKCSSAVEARLLRFWEAKNVKRGGELMWVDMLLIDVNLKIADQTLASGEGANQAAFGAELLYSPLSASRVATISVFFALHLNS
ncbi:hypothetical protein HID58_019558 [Brassica napus]|uniref:Uncharacterized protein n=1 Tax=Brassica napus TaxID=3708 RepID=A0ABQ8DD74_BRANA|nr:hypothetical protein HID58_019558 [Brassica napus]